MSIIKWWIKMHTTCKKCQDRWKKIKSVFGVEKPPNFVKVKAKTNEEIKEVLDLLFKENNEENKND